MRISKIYVWHVGGIFEVDVRPNYLIETFIVVEGDLSVLTCQIECHDDDFPTLLIMNNFILHGSIDEWNGLCGDVFDGGVDLY